MRKLFLAALLLIAVATSADTRWTARERLAVDYLLRAARWESVSIGLVLNPSPSYVAMRILATSPHADEAFKLLVADATPIGQLYGLLGLRRTDPAAFAMHARRLAGSRDEVMTFEGCIVSRATVASLVDEIRGGGFTVFLDGRPGESRIPDVDLRAAIEARRQP